MRTLLLVVTRELLILRYREFIRISYRTIDEFSWRVHRILWDTVMSGIAGAFAPHTTKTDPYTGDDAFPGCLL